MFKTVISALLLTVLLAVRPAHAADNEVVMRCILQEILSSLTCKPIRDFRFVGKRDEVYVFNTHYAAQFTEFYCQVFGKDVVITCKAWKGKMASARLNFETQPGCITATINSPELECPFSQTAQCCGAD